MKVKKQNDRENQWNRIVFFEKTLKSTNFKQDEQRYKGEPKFTSVRNKTDNITIDLADSKRQ